MKKLFVVLLVLLFEGCATFTPVFGGKSRLEYNSMVANNDPEVPCYVRGFRGGALFFDIVLGVLPVLFDAMTGAFRYYYYDPSSTNPNAQLCWEGEHGYSQPARTVDNGVRSAPVEKPRKKKAVVKKKAEAKVAKTSPVETKPQKVEPVQQQTEEETQSEDEFKDFYD